MVLPLNVRAADGLTFEMDQNFVNETIYSTVGGVIAMVLLGWSAKPAIILSSISYGNGNYVIVGGIPLKNNVSMHFIVR